MPEAFPTRNVFSLSGVTVIKDVTLVVDTSIYGATDLLSDCVAITNAVREAGGSGRIVSLTIIDEDDDTWAGSFFFCSENVDFGTINNTPSISDANAAKIMGYVASGTFVDLGGVKVNCVNNINVPIQAAADSKDIYVAAVLTSGTPTFAAASNIKIRVGIIQD